MTSTKESVIKLQRRGASVMTRSQGGVTDFGQIAAEGNVSFGSRFGRSWSLGRKAPAPGNTGGGDSSSANDSGGASNKRGSSNNSDGKSIAGLKGVSVFGGGGVPAETNPLNRGASAAAPGSGSLGVDDSDVVPAFADQNREPASEGNKNNAGETLVVAGANREITLGSALSQASAGPSALEDGKGSNERNEHHPKKGSDGDVRTQEGKTSAGKIGALLAALPLSKLKIIIGTSSY